VRTFSLGQVLAQSIEHSPTMARILGFTQAKKILPNAGVRNGRVFSVHVEGGKADPVLPFPPCLS